MPEASWSRASSSTFKSTKRLPELPLPPGSGGSDGGRQHRGSLVGILAGNQLRWPGTAPSPTGACGAGQPVLGTTGEWEQGVIAMPCPSTPPAACGCPTPSGQLFYQGALLVMGTSRTLPARACNTGCLVAPVLLPVLAPPPPLLLSLFLSPAPLSSNLITCQPVLIFASQSPSWMEGKD